MTVKNLHDRRRYERDEERDPHVIDDLLLSARFSRMKHKRVKVDGMRQEHLYYTSPMDMSLGLFFGIHKRRKTS